MIYRSNLEVPDLAPAFSHAVGSPRSFGHDALSDRDFDPDCGYITHDEAALLYNIARLMSGAWLEVGSHTGWSTAHIAIAGCTVVGLDPQFRNPHFFLRTYENLKAVGAVNRVILTADTTEGYFAEPKNRSMKFCGAFIDGNHDSPWPLNDAKTILPHLEDRAVVVFHDFIGRPIRDGVRFLIREGFRFHIYNTPQFLAVCWRGEFSPPIHYPDPSVDWAGHRASMTDFDFREMQ